MKKIALLFTILIFAASSALVAQVKATDMNLPDSVNKYDANGMKTGYWIERQGEMTFKGRYVNNKKNNNWVTYYSNNLIYKVEYFTDGVKDGLSLQFDRKGKLTLMENYSNGILHGETIYYGSYTETPMSETNFANGKKTGQFRQYYDNSKIQEESVYKNDIKNGISRWYNKGGRLIAEYHYRDGNFEGIQKTFYENDTVQAVSNYSGNQLSGEYKEYYRNGKMKLSGKYVAGLKEGSWTEYDEIGKAQKVVKYKAGVAK
jgi:antitoxin component YwqK of YwqJK toxin-antitoxin module